MLGIRRLEIAVVGIFSFYIGLTMYFHSRLYRQANHSSPGFFFVQQASPHNKGQFKKDKRRQRRRKKRSWDPGLDGLGGLPVPLNINLPIFSPSLPKSGTTSLWQYFNCGGHASSHQWVKSNETYSMQSGQCIRQNVLKGRPPFEGCGGYEVYTDTGYANFLPPSPGQLFTPVSCYYPSVDALEEIYQHYPNSTVVMVVRDTNSWYKSMTEWGEGSLLKRWKLCNATGFPSMNAEPKDFLKFYEWHTANIHRFAKAHPTMKYVEVRLESNETGGILEREIGIPRKCWAKCTPASKFCQPTKQS
jgi:hypothetical protein|uniref:Sulfotransferase n=1 Tax=Phaeodactylum tricornutum TaxID=2850 RepID=A0A8J9S6T4_PHATR